MEIPIIFHQSHVFTHRVFTARLLFQPRWMSYRQSIDQILARILNSNKRCHVDTKKLNKHYFIRAFFIRVVSGWENWILWLQSDV